MLQIDGGDFRPFLIGLDRFRERLEDATPVWEAFAQFLQLQHADGFSRQGQPGTSARWEPLSERYREYKSRVRPGKKILNFDGDLEDSLTKTGRGVRIFEPGFMVFGSDVPYAKYHMNGTPHMPARPPLIDAKRSPEFKRTLAKMMQEYILKGEI